MPRTKQILPGGPRIADHVAMGVLAKTFPSDLVLQVVRETGKASIRNRDLPSHLVVLYCLSLWLYRDVAYEDVLDCLLESCRWLGLPGSKGATKGAITQARDRLGIEPMQLLFNRVAVPMATEKTPSAWYRGLRVVAIDGTVFDTPDTKENAKEFGRTSNQFGSGPFPKVRAVVLSETSTHAPFGCAIGANAISETVLSRQLLTKLKPDMLMLADRGFFSIDLWNEFAATHAKLLWRIKTNSPVDVYERLEDGSYRASVRHKTEEIPVRVVVYQVEGSDEQIRLVTNILDPADAPAIELAGLYPQRWEAEHAFDEIKNHISGSRLALRSKKPDLVRQEIWALMLLHWALRDLIHDAAIAHSRDPDTISFVKTVRLVKLHFTKSGSFSP
jgi:hypothetical protein